VRGQASSDLSLVSGLGVQVAVGGSFQDPGRRRDLGLGRLEGPRQDGSRGGRLAVVILSPAVPGVDRNLALTVIMTAPGGGLGFLFSPDSWRGAVTMVCPEQDDPRLRSSAAGQGWSPARAIARVSGTPSISRLVIVAARAPRVAFDRSLSAMANTTP
jgi:hypothetical protein